MFQPAWGASSATGDARDAVSVLLLLILERLNPASDTGCVTQEGFICHWDTDWNNATWSDNVKTQLNNQLSWHLCRIAGWSILIKVATHCIPSSSQANVQYICTDFVWTKEPHRFINRNLSLYAQYRFVFVSILLFQCVIVALDSISFFFATGLALVTAVTGSPAFCIGIHTNVFLWTPFLVSYIIGFLLSPLLCFMNFTHSVFPMRIKLFCLFKTKAKTTCSMFLLFTWAPVHDVPVNIIHRKSKTTSRCVTLFFGQTWRTFVLPLPDLFSLWAPTLRWLHCLVKGWEGFRGDMSDTTH